MAPAELGPVIGRVREAVSGDAPRDGKLLAVCEVLKGAVAHYDWVGFYLVGAPEELFLGPYAGAPTEHTNIPFGSGVCGRCAESKETIVVQDVSAESGYLSCSIHVRSEIVVPVLRDGEFVGEIDIDSHAAGPFTEGDSQLLEEVARIVEPII